MKSTDMPARYVVGNLVDLLQWDSVYIQLRTITVLHMKTKATRFGQIYNVLAHMTPNLITDIHIWTPQICSVCLSKDALISVICILFVVVTFYV